MNVDLNEDYYVMYANDFGKYHKCNLKTLIEQWSTYRLKDFGTFLHVATYRKYRDEISNGISKNGFHIHAGYRFTYNVYRKSRLFEFVQDCWIGFATCKAIIVDSIGRVIDPVLILREYDKHVKPKAPGCMTWRNQDRGAKRKVYANRKRRARKSFVEYIISKHKSNDIAFDSIYDDELYSDIKIKNIRRTSVIDSYLRYESWWDRVPRSVEKNWKYQSKRTHQWKPKKI